LGKIRFVEDKDKAEWYKFDNHMVKDILVTASRGMKEERDMVQQD
jgi:hypothetical protein